MKNGGQQLVFRILACNCSKWTLVTGMQCNSEDLDGAEKLGNC
jgi:hypothetical protein